MDQSRGKNWYSFLALASIGLMGASGQAALLYNYLVHSYPFKMMDSPPAEFYARVGEIGYYISLSAALVGVIYSFRLRRVLVVVLPVVLSPLAYWLTFAIAHIVSGFSTGQMAQSNFEGATGYSNISAVTRTGFFLILVGSLVAFALSFFLLKAESIWRRSHGTL